MVDTSDVLGPPLPLPQGWILKESKSQPGAHYHYNLETGDSQWEAPAAETLVEKTQTQPSNRKRPAKEEIEVTVKRSRKEAHKEERKEKLVEVRVFHILRKHKDSRRPSSKRKAVITNTLEEAREEMEGLLEILKEEDPESLQETFAELAKTESDCSSAKRGGDLGFFKRKKMQAEFEAAAFSMKIGELSDLVETPSGVHVLLRVG